jgi:hypothetical protein
MISKLVANCLTYELTREVVPGGEAVSSISLAGSIDVGVEEAQRRCFK